jgi:type IV pilus assembly protein PilB
VTAIDIAELPPGLTAPPTQGRSRSLIGELLVELGYATPEQVHAAIAAGRASGRATGRVLVDDGTISPVQLAKALALRLGLHHVDLGCYPIDMCAANLLDASVARRHEAVPIGFLEGGATLLVAMADPANVLAVDDIALLTGLDVRPAIATPHEVAALISRLNGLDDAADRAAAAAAGADGPGAGAPPPPTPGSVPARAMTASTPDGVAAGLPTEEAPVITLVDSIIVQAVERGASDIHFVPQGGELRGQFRIDGVLSDAFTVPSATAQHVVARIKLMAGLDISVRRVPQDGRVAFDSTGRHIDLRVVTLPLVEGESIVMRILDRAGGAAGLDELGMLAPERARFEAAIGRPHGAVLVTGPTGSGKTTTLYAALEQLNTGEASIVTLEDPVEYRVAGIKQMQVNEKAGVTFATGLRSMMRADPDVVLVGEIRDRDTARIAVESALTGHLVLSTLHTNDAPTAITRLIEMGIEPFLVASAIECVVAQRLARRLCEHCRRPVRLSVDMLRSNGFPATLDVDAFDPGGCTHCNGTGYRGRLGLYEVMSVSEAIRTHTLEREPAAVIAASAVAEGMRRLREDGLEKIRAGLTSAAEAARVTVAA